MKNRISSLSLLTTQWHKNQKSYIDMFVPLFCSMLIKNGIQRFDYDEVEKIRRIFLEMYEIDVPSYAFSCIIQRAQLNKAINKNRDRYTIDDRRIQDFNILEEITENLAKQEFLINRYIAYIKQIFNEEIGYEIARESLITFIKQNDIDLLSSRYNGCCPEIVTTNDNKTQYYIARFISEMFVSDVDIYKIIVSMSVGCIAVNALFLATNNIEKDSLKKCVIYFDSSLVFPLLGADNKEKKETVKGLITAIQQKGAFIKIFDHTYQEINESLQTSVEMIDAPFFDVTKANRSTLFFKQEGYSKGQIELILASIDRILAENKILVEDHIPVTDHEFIINERFLEAELERRMSERNAWFKKDAYKKRTMRDIASISCVYQKRKNRRPMSFQQAKYLFVTQNGLLPLVNNKLLKNNQYADGVIPACVPDVVLGAYVWLDRPSDVVVNNEFKLIANALAAVRPTPELEKELYHEAKRMFEQNTITEDDFRIVTTSYLIKDLLSEKTLNVTESINEKTVESILDDFKESLVKEIKQEKQILYDELVSIKQRADEEERQRINVQLSRIAHVSLLKKKAEKRGDRNAKRVLLVIRIVLVGVYILSCSVVLAQLNLYFAGGYTIFYALFSYFINHEHSFSILKVYQSLKKKYIAQYYKEYELDDADLEIVK